MGTATPPIPPAFTVKWNREELTFGPITAPILIWEPKGDTIGLFARPNGMNIQIVFNVTDGTGTWSLSSAQGQATGTVAVQR